MNGGKKRERTIGTKEGRSEREGGDIIAQVSSNIIK